MTDLEVTEIVRAFVELGVVPNNDQAMALVKKFGLWIGYDLLRGEIAYVVEVGGSGITLNHDLNRAIVECVAKLQSAA